MNSILGKRARGQLPTKRTRVTRSFHNDDENQQPEEIPDTDDEVSESEELATFSPALMRTPSARRTKSIYKLEPVEYRKCIQPPPLLHSENSH